MQERKNTSAGYDDNKKFRDFFEHISTALVICRPDGSFLDMNEPFCRLTGYSEKELLNMTFQDITYPEDLLFEVEMLQKVIAGEVNTYTFEKRYIRKNRKIIWVNLTVSVIRDDKDQPHLFLGTLEDITLRKKAELKIKETEKKYRELLEMAPDAFFQGDIEGNILLVNKKAQRLTGYTKKELLGMKLIDLFSKETMEEKPLRFDLLDKGKTVSMEREMIRKDRFRIFVEMNSKKMPDGSYQSFFRDITDKITTRERLRISALATETSLHAVFASDINGSVTYANLTAAKMWGYDDPSEMIGTHVINYWTEESQQLAMQIMANLGKEGSIHNVGELIAKRLDGSEFIVESYASVIKDDEDNIIGLFGSFSDITERINAQNDLIEREIRLLRAESMANMGHYAFDIDGQNFVESEGLKKIWGFPPLSTNHFEDYVSRLHPEDREKALAAVEKGAEKLENFSIEYRVIRPDNKIVSIYAVSEFVPGTRRNVQRMFGTMIDITEFKRMEESIRKAEAHLEEAQRIAHLGSWEWDAATDTPSWSRELCHILGVDPDKPVPSVAEQDELYTRKSMAVMRKAIDRAMTTGTSYEIELEHVRKDGNRKWLLAQGEPVYDSHEKIIGLRGTAQDITERKLNEEQRLRFANMLEASLNEIYVFDAISLHFKYVNNGALVNLGYDRDDILQMTPLDIKPDYNFESFSKLLEPLKRGKQEKILFETRHRRFDGSFYPVEIHLQLLKFKNKKLYLAVVLDITERKKYEEQLILAKEKAEESDKLKTIFLANMSHEVRTPLNAILGFSSLLDSQDITSRDRQDFVKIIHNSGNRLMQIINDIVDISKIEAGQLTVNLKKVSLTELIENRIRILKNSDSALKKSKLRLYSDIPEYYRNVSLISDEVRLQQVLDNLILNAIKYTDEGIVEVGFNLHKDGHKKFIEIFVKDTGIGIPREKFDLVFERFRQVEETSFHEGAGLGLSIAKGLVEILGGNIRFISELGLGSTFYVSLPYTGELGFREKVTHMNGWHLDLSDKSIIIAEDDEHSFIYLNKLLYGHVSSIRRAENGKVLMDILEEELPDLVLLDINMPVKSGLECLKEIREKGLKLKVIGQTAYAMTEEIQKCINSGCDGYISKPINKEELFKVIATVLTSE